ncbi:ABC transporter substrate-binding protein [Enteractinococcus coprophilus]|uniref:Osmoprotectant transport system substrate-binding protein n=1 Tax=Enteractinococcus coprophilus TaxID=1027633 RepID=A0A543ANX8_9MICC|nr:ABC transporter substrate-binding protein [Enteractinococcus coprophilus]TQL74282.1 osmoprotectant transport system substrate-binding protein [Enteractinococcus coprophilus]
MISRRLITLSAAAVLVLTACSNPNTAAQDNIDEAAGAAESVSIGSANFPESEIISEIYAQALEAQGFEVDRHFQIGAREVYLPALENGEIDLIPEYTGNLLSYLDPDTTATSAETIEAELQEALPDALDILDPALAENKDSLNVTPEFAAEHDLTSIGDLAELDQVRLAANPEFAERSYGLPGMEELYGVTDVEFTAISDGGGPATVQALLDGTVDVADIYTTTPAIEEHNLVTLEDPEQMIAAQYVLPVIRTEAMNEQVVDTLNEVSAALTTKSLSQMNALHSGDDVQEPAEIAANWLEENDLN